MIDANSLIEALEKATADGITTWIKPESENVAFCLFKDDLIKVIFESDVITLHVRNIELLLLPGGSAAEKILRLVVGASGDTELIRAAKRRALDAILIALKG